MDRRYIYSGIVFISMMVVGLCVDIYSPSLPAVTHYFGVNKALVQLTMTTYIFGYALAQLFAGSLSDSFGRRGMLICASAAFSIVSFLIPLSHTIQQLLGLRLLQGVSVAYISVPVRAVIVDLFEGKEFYKQINYVSITWALGPIIAPALGGYLQAYFGWQASFYFLSGYGFVIFLLAVCLLPETIREKHSFKPMDVLATYWKIISNVEYMLGTSVLGLLYCLLIIFSVVGPFLIQTQMGYNAIDFGHMSLLIGLSWFLGNLANRFMINFNIANKVRIALFVMTMFSGIMLLLATNSEMTAYNIILPILVMFAFGGVVYPNNFAHCMQLFQRHAASAGALLGTVVILLASCGSVVGVMLKSQTQTPMAVAYLIISLICLLFSILMNYKQIDK